MCVHTVGIPGTKAHKGVGWLVEGVVWVESFRRVPSLSPVAPTRLHRLSSSRPTLWSETSWAARVQSSLRSPNIKNTNNHSAHSLASKSSFQHPTFCQSTLNHLWLFGKGAVLIKFDWGFFFVFFFQSEIFLLWKCHSLWMLWLWVCRAERVLCTRLHPPCLPRSLPPSQHSCQLLAARTPYWQTSPSGSTCTPT